MSESWAEADLSEHPAFRALYDKWEACSVEARTLRARLAALEPLCRAAVGMCAGSCETDDVLDEAMKWARSDHGREFAKGMKP